MQKPTYLKIIMKNLQSLLFSCKNVHIYKPQLTIHTVYTRRKNIYIYMKKHILYVINYLINYGFLKM